jgi:hypothetical protein
MKKVVNKGYTLSVVSWENDGDNYNTQTKTVETLQEAKVWYNMMQLCMSTLSNTSEFATKQKEIIINFMKENHKVLLPKEEYISDLIYAFTDLSGQLLGYSEYYQCRVCESCTVTYSEKDIFVEEIKF